MATTGETPGGEMVVYDRVTDPAKFIESLGADIFRSEMFGCQTIAQGRVMALECATRKVPPLVLAERYHLIKGKLSMKAEAMLTAFRSLGGTHRIIERTATRAAIELTRDGQTQTFELTWEQAAAEPFVYVGREDDVVAKLASGGKGLKLKPKYATPRSRMQMLWARVVSDSVGAVAPDVRNGCYTPEELSDFDYVAAGGRGKSKAAAASMEEQADAEERRNADEFGTDGEAIEVQAETEPASGETIQEQADTAVAQGQTTQLLTTEEEVDAAAHEQVVTEAKNEAAKAASPVGEKPAAGPLNTAIGTATEHQLSLVKQLFGELQVPRDRLLAMLKRVNAATVASMSAAHCQALIDVLNVEKRKRETAKN